MKILIIISSANPEVQWNALRFGNMALNEGDDVAIFLNGPAVDLKKGDSPEFPLLEQTKLFSLSEGQLAA
jgi:DsrE/DsrF-like family.